jgi:hypothetical protein
MEKVKSMEFEIRAPRVFISKKGEGTGEDLQILRCSSAGLDEWGM